MTYTVGLQLLFESGIYYLASFTGLVIVGKIKMNDEKRLHCWWIQREEEGEEMSGGGRGDEWRWERR